MAGFWHGVDVVHDKKKNIFKTPRSHDLLVKFSKIQALIKSPRKLQLEKNTRWSYSIYKSWRREPKIETMYAEQLNFYLRCLIMRVHVRRKDGKEFHAKTFLH